MSILSYSLATVKPRTRRAGVRLRVNQALELSLKILVKSVGAYFQPEDTPVEIVILIVGDTNWKPFSDGAAMRHRLVERWRDYIVRIAEALFLDFETLKLMTCIRHGMEVLDKAFDD